MLGIMFLLLFLVLEQQDAPTMHSSCELATYQSAVELLETEARSRRQASSISVVARNREEEHSVFFCQLIDALNGKMNLAPTLLTGVPTT
jgi:hypothetical protein